MSYDLLVFDPQYAPRERDDFMTWYRTLTRWEEPRDYNDPAGMTGNLPAFFDSLRQGFPPMNGPYAYDFDPPKPAPRSFWNKLFGTGPVPAEAAIDEAQVTDYSLAQHAIYMGFAWSVADMAYQQVFNTALSSGVGFFDVSANDGVILHDANQFYDLMGL